ncbi:recombinase family protein [Sphingopyxis sp. 550A]
MDQPGIREAVLYARVSTPDQQREGYSIPSQVKLLEDYAALNGIVVVSSHIDVETARKSGRTAFGNMLRYLKRHPEVRIILVEKTDRLYRNLKDWAIIDDLGVEVHFVKENAVMSDGCRSSEKFVHGIKVLMAKAYIDNLSEETRKGMLEKAQQGHWPSFAPLGYLNAKDGQGRSLIAIDPELGPIVTRIFDWYRTVLDTYTSNGGVVAVQIEATAKAGRIDEAKALLEHERGGLGADECQFLDATLAEVEGSDPIPMRLAHYETSKATHDLLILTEAMREKRDPRLGEYLIELWRRRAQISDAQDACDILISIGEEARVEEFVLELGDDARSDPGLHVHLAWVRFRRGELELAESELDALAARGIDNSNTRQLSVLIAVETGRWADLQRFVRTQLDQSADRSAIDLMSAAKIAQAIGSPITMDLLRAAVRKDATNPAICLQGYTIAVEAGLERVRRQHQWRIFEVVI